MESLKDTIQFGTIIRIARKEQGLTQEQLAGICGVGVRFIRELEHGKDSCQIGKAIMVMQMLGVEILVNGPDTDMLSGDGRSSGSGSGLGDGSGWG